MNHIFGRASKNLTAEVKQEEGEKRGTLIPISFVNHVLITSIPWLTLSLTYYPNNLQQPPLSRLSSGSVYLKHLLLDGPQSAAVYLSITHLEAKRWRSLFQSHQNSRGFVSYISTNYLFTS